MRGSGSLSRHRVCACINSAIRSLLWYVETILMMVAFCDRHLASLSMVKRESHAESTPRDRIMELPTARQQPASERKSRPYQSPQVWMPALCALWGMALNSFNVFCHSGCDRRADAPAAVQGNRLHQTRSSAQHLSQVRDRVRRASVITEPCPLSVEQVRLSPETRRIMVRDVLCRYVVRDRFVHETRETLFETTLTGDGLLGLRSQWHRTR
jgi:hypothetical protein